MSDRSADEAITEENPAVDKAAQLTELMASFGIVVPPEVEAEVAAMLEEGEA